jgi:hypothetical protein
MEDDYFVDMFWPDGRKYRFRFGGGPLAHPDVAREPMEAYGFCAASWARLETHIDAIALCLNRQQNSPDPLKLHEPRHPSGVRDKIKLIRRWFKGHPALASSKQVADALCEKLLDLALERNQYLHSVIEDYDSSTGTLVLHGIFTKPDTTTSIQRTEIPMGYFGAFARKISDCNQELSKLSSQLFQPDMPGKLQKP